MSEVANRAGGAGQGADPLWDDWETPPRVPSSPELHLDGFDGPLDLLLDLVERKRIDLRRMSALAMVEQFAEAMERYAAHVALERRADWLVMAARLVLLRSRLCFPASLEEQRAAEQEVRDTRRQLDELRVVRAAAAWLEARPQLGRDVFARPGERVSPRVASYMDLMEACLAALLRGEELEQQQAGEWATTMTVRPNSLYPISGIIRSIRLRLQTSTSAACLESFAPAVSRQAPDLALAFRMALSATFIAALELGRTGELNLSQGDCAEQFQPIFVQAGPNTDELGQLLVAETMRS